MKLNQLSFKITTESDKIIINCKSQSVNGYSYILKKGNQNI